MTTPPAKIKAFLSSVKDEILERDVSDTSKVYLTLLRLELLLRSVLINVDEGEKSVLTAVQSTAGKPLTESWPPPLQAGASAVAGRVAGLLSKHLNSQSLQDAVTAISKSEEYKAAVITCQNVKDERFKCLLALVSPSVVTSDSTTPNLIPSLQFRILKLSQGYYLRAASIQSDTPPMWKAAWDALLEQQSIGGNKNGSQHPFRAYYPLSNLIRIAASKGNQKRVSELSCSLAKSYLSAQSFDAVSSSPEANEIQVAFCAPYEPKNDPSLRECAKLAETALKDCQDMDDKILYQSLQLQSVMLLEDAEIEESADGLYQASKNRSQTISMEQARSKARTEYLEEFSGDEQDRPFEAAKELWHLVSRRAMSSETEISSSIDQAYDLLTRNLARLCEKAKAIALKRKSMNTWRQTLDFLDVIFKSRSSKTYAIDKTKPQRLEILHDWISDGPISRITFFSKAATLWSTSQWMLSSEESNEIKSNLEDTLFMVDLLTVLIQVMKDQKEQAKQSISSDTEGTAELLACQCARVASNAKLAALSKTPSRHVPEEASSMYQKNAQRYSSSQGVFGMAFWQCLVSWDGLIRMAWSFSTISEARKLIKEAQHCLQQAQKEWNRPVSDLEQLLMDLAQADAEGGLLSGGFAKEAAKLYESILERLTNSKLHAGQIRILRSVCLSGLTRVSQSDQETSIAEKHSRQSLSTISEAAECGCGLYLWSQNAMEKSAKFQLNISRQLVADCLVRSGNPGEARALLEEAVLDSPSDPEAAFTLGSFRLRMAFFGDQPETAKEAQILLLKAAKLDSSKASPFALLGVWFEEQGDLKRALGCYTKSLNLEVAHPVAGRGLLRLQGSDSSKETIQEAINTNSSYNGWAWRAVAKEKIMDEHDELAVVALLKALRSKDIEVPMNQSLGIFYQGIGDKQSNEFSDALAELAMCYRRLGRFTAAIRAFHAAREAAGDDVSSQVLCSCAQVELDLGLFDEAAEKFAVVLDRPQDPFLSIASYGHGSALLSMAQRDIQDGKSGSAHFNILKAVETCQSLSKDFGCARKLLGDLHSTGFGLPPDVFAESEIPDRIDLQALLQKQLTFVSNGEQAYRESAQYQVSDDEEELRILKSSSICDAGVNILLQAQLRQRICESKVGGKIDLAKESVEDCKRAEKEFTEAIEVNPLNAVAWCGLGCAVASKDPILAQHAFSRSLQIDKMLPDSYANIGVLYSEHGVFHASDSVMDALTQVADTPMMWINRAINLERNAEKYLSVDSSVSEKNISRAADAYRASLQVMQHPAAMLGLSATCRLELKDSETGTTDSRRKESNAQMEKYIGQTNSTNMSSVLLSDVMKMEKGVLSLINSWGTDILAASRKSLAAALADPKSEKCGLDLKSIKEASQSTITSEVTLDSASKEDFSLARQIGIEPNRADLWLAWAKQLAKEKSLGPARTAASRAVTILSKDLEISHRKSSGSVNAKQLSEALSLSCWLERLQAPKSGETKEEDEGLSEVFQQQLGLQRSLMMCPTNVLARAVLQHTSSN